MATQTKPEKYIPDDILGNEENTQTKPKREPRRSTVVVQKEEDDLRPNWIMYSDLITQVMIFFMLLFTMSTVDNSKLLAMQESIPQEMSKSAAERLAAAQKEENDMKKLSQNLGGFINAGGMGDKIKINSRNGVVELTVDAPVFFNIGDSDLLPSAYPFLDIIIATLKENKHRIVVEGHTDDVPIATVRFKNNWELSTSRASSVVGYFIDKGINPVRLTAAGYGQFRPLVPNDSEANRTKNRRVEIKLMPFKDKTP